VGVKRNAFRVLAENLKKRDHFENLVVNGRIIFKWSLKI
jgi:hypothetical protein